MTSRSSSSSRSRSTLGAGASDPSRNPTARPPNSSDSDAAILHVPPNDLIRERVREPRVTAAELPDPPSRLGLEALAGRRRVLFEQLRQSVTTGETDSEKLGKLAVLAGVHNYPSRVKCAILSWHALMSALKGEALVTTENEQT